MKLGQHVVLIAKGTITKVTHATTGNGLERQHVAVLDGVEWLAVDFDELVAAALRIQSTIDTVDIDTDGMTVQVNDGPEASMHEFAKRFTAS